MTKGFSPRFYDIVICVNCQGEFFRAKKKRRQIPAQVRPYKCKTCTPKCSNEWRAKAQKIFNKKYREMKHEKN